MNDEAALTVIHKTGRDHAALRNAVVLWADTTTAGFC
jgi:hypothetical protein